MKNTKTQYGNDSISSLKGADRVRKRPGVIFGSDGLEGCQHAVFEILSNSIDEAREGYGSSITVTAMLPSSSLSHCALVSVSNAFGFTAPVRAMACRSVMPSRACRFSRRPRPQSASR